MVTTLVLAAAAVTGIFGEPVKVDGVGAKAQSLAVDGKWLYCGAGDSLFVLDASEPLKPKVVKRLDGFGHLRQLAVNDGLLAVSSRGGGAWLVDVADPAAAKVLSHYDSVEQATGIELAGKAMFIGQRQVGVEMVDITDPRHPEHIRMIQTQESQTCLYSDGMLCSGDWHSGKVNFISTEDLAKSAIVSAAEMHGLGDGLDIDGDTLYASTGHHRLRGPDGGKSTDPRNFGLGHGLDIFDISDRLHPKHLKRIDFPKFYRIGQDMWTARAAGGWVFCADTYNGLFAVDARKPEQAEIVGHFKVPNSRDSEAPSHVVTYVELGNGAVYASVLDSGLWVIPCQEAKARARKRGREPGNVAYRDTYRRDSEHFHQWTPPKRGQVHSAAAYGKYVYAGCSDAGAYVISQSGKTLAALPSKYARDVYVRGDLLYVAEGAEGLAVYSLKDDPVHPKPVRRITDFGRGSKGSCEWVKVPDGRWALCHDLVDMVWRVMDLSKEKPECVLQLRPALPWVRPIADEFVGGRYLGYAKTHGEFVWIDFGGDKPTAVKVPVAPRVGSAAGCTAIGKDALLFANDPQMAVLAPGEAPTDWSAKWLKLPGGQKIVGGLAAWDGGHTVALASTKHKTVNALDFTDSSAPKLLWTETTLGFPQNPSFADGRMLVPCGYQGLLIQKK